MNEINLPFTHLSSFIPPPFPRIAIIGGGISGLACAHRLLELATAEKRLIEIIVIESSSRFGGTIHTEYLDNFTLEAGPDSFIAEKPEAARLAERLDIAHRIISTNANYRRSFIVRDGRLRVVPAGFRLLAPSQLLPFFRSDAFSPRARARIAFEMFVPRRKNTSEDETLASFVRRRFGREALERMAQPMVGGIYTADPEQLSLQATMPRFLEMERRDRSLILSLRRAARQMNNGAQYQTNEAASTSGARYNLFLSFDEGMNVLTNALVKRLQDFSTERYSSSSGTQPTVTLRANTHVDNLIFDAQTKRWQINFGDTATAETLAADAVCLALPAHAAARLLSSVDAEIAAELAAIPYASTATINFAYRREDVPHALDGFGFVSPFIERRTALACSFSSVKFANRAPENHVLLRSFAGGALQSEVFDLDDETLIARVQQDLRELLGITRPPLFTRLTRWRDSMAQYHLGHLERIRRIETRLQNLPSLQLAGNAYRGAGVPDCIRSGEAAAEEIYRMVR